MNRPSGLAEGAVGVGAGVGTGAVVGGAGWRGRRRGGRGRVAGAAFRSVSPVLAGGVAAGVAAMGAAVADSARSGLDRGRAERAAVPSLVRYAASGPPPLVREVVDLIGLGVHPAAPGPAGDGGPASRVPPYVPRDADARLREAVTGGGLVLLVGESTAGKSRAAFEAVRAVCPAHRLVVPAAPDAVAGLGPVLAGMRRAVVWLDDLERYLGPGGLDLTELTAWLSGRDAGHVVVMSTIRTAERQRYTAGGDSRDRIGRGLWRTAREVVEQATGRDAEIFLHRRWSPGELDRAARFSDDPRIEDALRGADRFGVAETLAAGPEIARAWKAAWAPGTHPRGAALVAAAVDARRAGLDTPLSRDLLLALHGHYLAEQGGPLMRPESEADALAWATDPAFATSSPLLPVGDEEYPAFLAFDYLLDLPDLPPVPDATWTALVERITPDRAYRVGRVSLGQYRTGPALTAFTRATDAEVPLGRYYLELTLGDAGRPKRALARLHQVRAKDHEPLGRDHPNSLRTRSNIARWTGETGDATGALNLYRQLLPDFEQILGPDHPNTLRTRSNIARWTGETGDATGALNLYRQLLPDFEQILGPHDPNTLRTRSNIARWTGETGDATGALNLYRQLLPDREQILGPDHPDTFTTRHQIAYYTGETGGATGALNLYRELLTDRERILGPDHPSTLRTRHQVAYWSEQVGDESRPDPGT